MARNVLGRMAESAWRCGDPGVMFIDTVNRHNPLPGLGPIETTNPCGEQPLAPYESCNLGSINLDRFGGPDGFDYPGLAASVHTAVRFLDDVIDVNRYPLDRIAKVSRANRKIGLGVMGLADALIRMGIDYASPEAEAAGGQVMAFVQDQAHRASAELAEVRGDFPHFRQSVHHDRGVRRMRNATVTTVAPTGSLSLIAGCSPGIEPLFALSYRRKMLGDTEVVQIHEGFEAEARRRGVWSDQLADHLETHGHLEGFEDLPEDMKRRYRTAHQIDPERHLAIQAAFQAHTDNAVSKTVNLAPNAEVRTVADVFVRAWQRGLKGVTVYRSGCRGEQVVRWGEDGPEEVRGAPTCPECGLTLNSEGGCWHCPSCGRSGCA
jgi:ribonucleoside-diphosphate reductase alpha chain